MHSLAPWYLAAAASLLVLPSLARADEGDGSDVVIFVVDTSGSMEGERMTALNASLQAALEALDGDDRVAVIAFDSQPREHLPLREVEGAAAVLRPLQAAGGTEIAPALELAVSVLADASGERRQIVLMSDGQAPVGSLYESADALEDAGMTLSTLALGESADRELLEALAGRGGGESRVIDEPDQLEAALLELVGPSRDE